MALVAAKKIPPRVFEKLWRDFLLPPHDFGRFWTILGLTEDLRGFGTKSGDLEPTSELTEPLKETP